MESKSSGKMKSNEDIDISNQNQEKFTLPSKTYQIINNKYLLFKKLLIGSGSFGKVLYGLDINLNKEYAIKIEKSTVKRSVLKFELSIYKALENVEGIPKIYYFSEEKSYKIMIMDLLGPSIDKYFKLFEKKFSLKSTIMLSIQMFKRIASLHEKGIVHRDIKPNNFLLGIFNKNYSNNMIYLIDFGLSKFYIENNAHIEFKNSSRFVGTPRYASLNAHLGYRQSRRDDLESIFYLIIYFLKGDLPWQGIRAKTKSEKKEKIKNKKRDTTIDEICTDCPIELKELFSYIRSLAYDETPKYSYIVGLLEGLALKNKIVLDDNWDWNVCFTDKILKTGLNKTFAKLYEGYPNADIKGYINYCVEKSNQTSLNKITNPVIQNPRNNNIFSVEKTNGRDNIIRIYNTNNSKNSNATTVTKQFEKDFIMENCEEDDDQK